MSSNSIVFDSAVRDHAEKLGKGVLTMPTQSDIIMDRVREIGMLTPFQIPQWWLTVVLTGRDNALRNMIPFLASLHGKQLDDALGGFLHPKLPVANDPRIIAALIDRIVVVARMYDVTVCAVDADTSPDVFRARFEAIIDF